MSNFLNVIYIIICRKINENNHIKRSYNPIYKEKDEHHTVHTYQSEYFVSSSKLS